MNATTTAAEPATAALARWFPLVPRPRPPCLPVEERVRRQLQEPARAARGHTRPHQAVATAASVLNQAALLTSDAGHPDLARELCWHQFDTFRTGWPLDPTIARCCLEPLVNLARLAARDGDPDQTGRILNDLYHATAHGSDFTVDNRTINLGGLSDPQAHKNLQRWLWTVLLADVVQALGRAGRWDDAAAHAAHHRGIGNRLLDGRQALALAHHASGDQATALELVADAKPLEPWEHLAATVLTAAIRRADTPLKHAYRTTGAHSRRYPAPQHRHFHIRARLALLDLAHPGDPPEAARQLVQEILHSRDGSLARQCLATERIQAGLTVDERRALTSLLAAARLGQGLPRRAHTAIQTASGDATEVIVRHLCANSSSHASFPTVASNEDDLA